MSGDNKTYADVIVIGAGLHGACLALKLSEMGKNVIVLDKGLGGRHSSASNAGGVRRLWRAPAELPLAFEAADMWRNIESIVDDHCGYQETGGIKIAENKAEFSLLEERVHKMKQLGYGYEILIDREELKQLLPHLSNHCYGALIVKDDGFASPFRTTTAFQQKAQKNGSQFFLNEPVTNILSLSNGWSVETKLNTYEGEVVVNCAGAWGDQIAQLVGDSFELSAEAPTMMVTAPIPKFLTPVIGAVGRKLSFKQAPNGIVLIGGGYRGSLDRNSGCTWVDFSKLAESARTVIDFFPHMADVPIVRTWCGIEGLTPDRLPIIGKSPQFDNFFHVFGFSSHGFQLAPIVGVLMAEQIISGKSHLPLSAFSPTRFNSHTQN